MVSRNRVTLVATFALILSCGGDGGDDPIYSCDFYSQISSGGEEGEYRFNFCYEFTDPNYEAEDKLLFKDEKTKFEDTWVSETTTACGEVGGTWAEAECTRDGRELGICALPEDTESPGIEINGIVSSYPILEAGQSANQETISESCSDIGGTYRHTRGT